MDNQWVDYADINPGPMQRLRDGLVIAPRGFHDDPDLTVKGEQIVVLSPREVEHTEAGLDRLIYLLDNTNAPAYIRSGGTTCVNRTLLMREAVD